MKGIDLCEAYYRAYGERMIKTKFPAFMHKVAVGLVGEGSECFGFDDEISRDHDWGPGFCIWLDSDDYNEIGPAMQTEYERLPKEFENFERISSAWGKSRVGVFEIGAFYQRFIGLTCAPDDNLRWFYMAEPNLAACTNGKVFYDPLGKFSKIREKLLQFFPEDVRLAKIASRCATAAQAGQYNFRRMARRHQPFVAQYAATKFSAEIISLVFLLNRRFCPFYKWSHRAMLSLPVMGGSIYSRIDDLAMEPDIGKKIDLVEEISSEVIMALHRQNLSDLTSDFLLDHANAVGKKISDPKILERIRPLGEM
jgi:hypothetical protein